MYCMVLCCIVSCHTVLYFVMVLYCTVLIFNKYVYIYMHIYIYVYIYISHVGNFFWGYDVLCVPLC